jgi:hypothetical protein
LHGKQTNLIANKTNVGERGQVELDNKNASIPPMITTRHNRLPPT